MNDDDEFDRRQTRAMIRAEVMHREQLHDLELRKERIALKTAEFLALSAEAQCRQILGVSKACLVKRLEAMTGSGVNESVTR